MRSANISATGLDATADQSAGPMLAHGLTTFSGQCVVAGTSSASATLKLQWSNDQEPSGWNPAMSWRPTNWFDLGNDTATISADGAFGVTSSGIIGARWIQLVYVATSVTGGTVDLALYGSSV